MERPTVVELDAEYMKALYTLNLQRVRATAVYAEMCRAAKGNCHAIDEVVEEVFGELRQMRDSDLDGWVTTLSLVEALPAGARSSDYPQTEDK